MIALTPRVELLLKGTWQDVSADVVSDVKAEWGIHGSSPKDRVAEPGTLSFDLDNSAQNSGGKRGYYSPGHADARNGFALGCAARLRIVHPLYGDRVKWVGTISALRPVAGAASPRTAVSCVDWMDEAARAKLSGLAVATNVQSDDVFNLLAAAVENQPPGGIQYGTGSDIYPFALDNTQDESSRVLGELQKLALSEYGLVYVAAGVLVFEGRRRRAGAGAVRFALDEDEQIVGLGVSHDRDDIANRVQVAIHPRRRDASATTVLFSLGAALRIERGTSVEIKCPYRDPNQQAQRVGGIDMVAPVAGTDYSFAELEDGTGADLTAQLAVTPVFGGNAAVVTVANAGPYDGYIPAGGLQLRGRGLYDFEPVFADVKDQTSIDSYGETPIGYDMPYQSSPANALDLAAFLLALNKGAQTRVQTVSYVANWSDEAAEQALNLEISDRVSITAPTLGLAARPFYVNGVRLEVRMAGVVVVTYDLAPVDTAQFWLLEVDGRSELDETTVLGYGLFVPGWILDQSALGTDTFLN